MLAAFDTGIGGGSTVMGGLIHQLGFRPAFGIAAVIAASVVALFLLAERRSASIMKWRRHADQRRPLSFLLAGLVRTRRSATAGPEAMRPRRCRPGSAGTRPVRMRRLPIDGSPNGIGIMWTRRVDRQRAGRRSVRRRRPSAPSVASGRRVHVQPGDARRGRAAREGVRRAPAAHGVPVPRDARRPRWTTRAVEHGVRRWRRAHSRAVFVHCGALSIGVRQKLGLTEPV